MPGPVTRARSTVVGVGGPQGRQELLGGSPLVEEGPAVPDRDAEGQRPLDVAERAVAVTGCVAGERPQERRLDDTPLPVPGFRRGDDGVEHPDGRFDAIAPDRSLVAAGPRLREHQPGEREPVELGEVRRLVGEADPALPGPLPRLGEPPLGDADPRPLGRHGAQVREEPGDDVRRRLVEHRHRAVEVTARLTDRGGDGVPAVAVLGERAAVAELGGGVEVALGRVEVALLAEHVGEGDVEVTAHRRPHAW